MDRTSIVYNQENIAAYWQQRVEMLESRIRINVLEPESVFDPIPSEPFDLYDSKQTENLVPKPNFVPPMSSQEEPKCKKKRIIKLD
jgi:hypothetical protein